MRAIVLVGGQGTRLRPLTYTTPKQMLPVAEVPMIERVLEPLARCGVEEVVLSMGYRPDAFLTRYPEGTCAGIPVIYAVEPEPRDTAGGIRYAARAANIDDTFIVINGDVLADRDLPTLLAFHRARRAEATILLKPVDDVTAFGVVGLEEDGRVHAFIEKPRADEAPSNLINAGTYILEPAILDRIPGNAKVNIERETFPLLVAAGTLYGLAGSGYWSDAGTPELYLQANLDWLSGAAQPGPPIPHARERAPGIWIAGGPVVHGRLEGPALIGDAAFVDHDAVVRNSVIGAGCRVERGARVVDSVLLAGAALRPGSVVLGSIVGEGALIGDNARLHGLTVVQGGARVASGADLDGVLVTA